jgi:hypothetical protein
MERKSGFMAELLKLHQSHTAMESPAGVVGLRMLQSNARIDLLMTDVGLQTA